MENQIILVDDGSSDKTVEIVENNFEDIIFLKHKINLGKGAALKTGCEAARRLGADIIVLIDSDGQHQPETIPQMIEKLRRENLDIVLGAREINNDMPPLFYIGNVFLTKLINWSFRINISDTQTGFKAFKSNVYDKIFWRSRDYFVDTEILANMGKNRLKYGEVAIKTIYNDSYKGTTFFDGLKIFLNVIKQKIL